MISRNDVVRLIEAGPESQFDELAQLAAQICAAPIGVITLADGDRLWLKAKYGTGLTDELLLNSICHLASKSDGLLVIEDLAVDPRFSQHELVTSGLRFYAGHPIQNQNGVALATLCVFGLAPQALSDFQRSTLAILARQVEIGFKQSAQEAQLRDQAPHGVDREVVRSKEEQVWIFQTIFNNLPVGIIQVHAHGGKIEMANKAYAELVGYTEEEIGDFTVHDLTHPDDRPANIINLALHANSRTGFFIEKRYIKKNGDLVWVRVRGNPIRENEDFFSCVIFDISEERKAMASEFEASRLVKEREQQLEIATAAAYVGIWEWDLATQVVRMNSIERELFAIDPSVQEATYEDFVRPVHPEDRVWLEATLARVIAGEIEYNHEFRCVFGDEVRWYSGRGKVIRNEVGKAVRMVGANTDITAIRRDALEKEQLKMRELAAVSASQLKTEFLANMSHEIRTPLNGVIGLTELLLDTELAPEQLHFAQAIKQSSNVLLAQINDILDFTKIEAGKLDLDHSVFDLGELLRDIEQCFKPLARDKNLGFQLNVDLKHYTRYLGDSGRLRQVLMNLVGNALKFTREGRIDVFVSAEEPGELTRIAFCVKDTGIGVSAQARKKLFKSFSQADASTAREFGGTGLGLAICKRLIQMMGGDISVASKEGNGAEFRFHILLQPLLARPTEAARISPRFAVDPAIVASRGRCRILVAEDNSINQEVVLRFLCKAGFVVDVVANGEEAVQAVHATDYQLVLMDCQMPVKDGYQAAGELRARGKNLPIIALTANAFTTDRERCLSVGMVDYLTKPIRHDVLVEAVDRWLGIY